MNIMKNALRALTVFVMICVLTASFAGCGKEGSSSDNQSTDSKAQNSELQPITVFFPDELIKFKSSGQEDITVKGNRALRLEKEKARVYDPLSLEGINYDSAYSSVAGIGLGIKYEKLAEVYGLKHGTCYAVSDTSTVLDVSTLSGLNSKFFAKAILILGSDGSISYAAPGRIPELITGFLSAGSGYSNEAQIGDDFLILEATFDGGVMTEFVLTHFTF